MKRKLSTFLFFYGFYIFSLTAQTLRSVHYNPPSTDNGYEYVEIQGAASSSLNNVWLIEIDGDVPSTNLNLPGTIKTAKNLSGQTIGSNGLFLIRDAATALVPAPSAGTNVFVSDFSPDLENGTTTFLLVTNFTGAVGDDIDADNDGVPNTTLPWGSILDAVGVIDSNSDPNDRVYATFPSFTGTSLPDIPSEGADAVANFNGTWYAVNVSGASTNPGPYTVSAAWNKDGTKNTALTSSLLSPGVLSSPLPVQLISFNGYSTDKDIVLEWQTAEETNHSHFELQKSTNGLSFETIGLIDKASEFFNYQKKYVFTDYQPHIGVNYYRLKQIDFGGKYTYSKIIAINFQFDNFITIYPNPTADFIQIRFNENINIQSVLLYDLTGNILSQSNNNSISLKNYPNGTYYLEVSTEDSRIFKQKILKF